MRPKDKTARAEMFFTSLLQKAGINVDGANPWRNIWSKVPE